MDADEDENPLLNGQPLNADSYNAFADVQRGEGLRRDTFCFPTPEEWCRRMAKHYEPM